MAKKGQTDQADTQQEQAVDQIKRRIDMLDQRLDNIDSVVSAVAERVMNHPVTFHITCSKCGQKLEIAIIGTQKPNR